MTTSFLSPGRPQRLGATCIGRETNFALYAPLAERVELCLFDGVTTKALGTHVVSSQSDGVWHGVLPREVAGPGTLYAFRVYGESDPDKGLQFDGANLLIDPYARRLVPGDPNLSMVVDSEFDWQGDVPPGVPWRDSLIYELHVKGFTQLHTGVPERWRGKYLGLTAPAIIEHLQSLKLTAVELLPCQAFLSEQFLLERGLKNYWGYNSIAWFAPAAEYACDDPVDEFKTLVRELHKAGIEVILDVVFNHTAEGNEQGPVLSFKGIDNSLYYRLMAHDARHYDNVTGCGNTVNCDQAPVRSLIIDCMKYWVEEMHVDGFRFDLATVVGRNADGFDPQATFFNVVRAEPALAFVKLIAEPWDVGPGGYQLGRFPAGWSEWNDRFRDEVRSFWRGDPGKVGELAERFAGSSDLFRVRARRPSASINFVTSHDGFTLNDLVSYNDRHNEANLEGNGDGHSQNLSWNCGAEGPTADATIDALRRRQMKNLLATLLLSQGVPMLQAGDEFARTQSGNNNAYCQDNEISWVVWNLSPSQQELLEFARALCRLRGSTPQFRRDTFLKGGVSRINSKDVSWLAAGGGEMTDAAWNDGASRSLGIRLAALRDDQSDFLLLLNAAPEVVSFVLPAAPGDGQWNLCFDTQSDASLPVFGALAGPAIETPAYALAAHSFAMLQA